MQKFFDQAISGNWSYNPENYPDNEVPVSEMAQDWLTTYKYGWKTSYYQNTHDQKSDDVEQIVLKENPAEVGFQGRNKLQSLVDDILNTEEEACESCAI